MAVLRERTLATALFARIPKAEEVDRGFSECCYDHIVLADAGSNDIEKNDFFGLYFQKQSSIDTCDFVLIKLSDLSEYALNDGTYGEFYDFGDFTDSENMTQYIVEWKKVLLAHGPGQYRLRRDVTVSGIAVQLSSYTCTLKQFSNLNADKTFRFDIVMNGVLQRENLNFTNTNFRHSLRTRGFFGNVDPEWTQKTVVYRTKNSNTPTYIHTKAVWVLETDPIPSCITKELLEFMIFAKDKWLSDYNANNHDYELTRKEVVFEDNGGTTYASTTRNAKLKFKVSERYLDKNRRDC